MSLKPGTLVRYAPTYAVAAFSGGLHSSAACWCFYTLSWGFDKIESSLIGMVLETKENKKVKIEWFGINKIFNEYKKYLEVVREI